MTIFFGVWSSQPWSWSQVLGLGLKFLLYLVLSSWSWSRVLGLVLEFLVFVSISWTWSRVLGLGLDFLDLVLISWTWSRVLGRGLKFCDLDLPSPSPIWANFTPFSMCNMGQRLLWSLIISCVTLLSSSHDKTCPIIRGHYWTALHGSRSRFLPCPLAQVGLCHIRPLHHQNRHVDLQDCLLAIQHTIVN